MITTTDYAITHPLLSWDIIGWTCQLQDTTINKLIQLGKKNNWQSIETIINAYNQDDYAVVITCHKQEIAYVNLAFEKMTQYAYKEVTGMRPGFLQRKDVTNIQANYHIGTHIKQGKEAKSKLVNYKKDGTKYLCEIHIIPIKNTQGAVVHFLALEKEIAA